MPKFLKLFRIPHLPVLFFKYPTALKQFNFKSLKQYDWQAGFIKISKRLMISYLIGFMAFSTVTGLFFFNPFIKGVEAAWFNENWYYRQRVPVDTHASAETSRYINISVDTAALTTDKLQADCDDLRFTKENGEVLPYNIVSGCDTSTTSINVGFDSMPAAPFNFYMYYGNPSASAGSTTLTEAACAVTCTAAAFGSEEKAPQPVATWKMDDPESGTTTKDSSTNALNGTFGVADSSGPVKIDDASDFGVMVSASRQIVRTSEGILYAALNDPGNCEIWKSTNGTTWTQQDAATTISCSSGFMTDLAIDGNDTLHLVYRSPSASIKYRSMTDDVFSAEETIYTAASNSLEATIAVDSNNKPHVALTHSEGLSCPCTVGVRYSNRISGSWKTTVTVETIVSGTSTDWPIGPSLAINEDNIPEISYREQVGDDLTAAVGDVNDAASFTLQDVDTDVPTGTASTTSIAIDSAGNTWIVFVDEDGASDLMTLAKHNDGDAWSTWTTDASDATLSSGIVGSEPQIAIIGTDKYVFYTDSGSDIAYSKYDGSWTHFADLATGTFQDVRVKWSNYFNNNGSNAIDYMYSDATDVYWGKVTIVATNPAPTWKTPDMCVSGNCLSFDGDDYVEISDSTKLQPATAITVSSWFKTSSTGAMRVVRKTGNGYGLDVGYINGTTTDAGKVSFWIHDGTTYKAANSPNTFNDGKWHHALGTYDKSNVKLYVDGVLVATTAETDDISYSAGGISIGRNGHTSSGYFTGFIDETKIYNYALTAAQASANFNAKSNPDGVALSGSSNVQNQPGALTNGLTGYWQVDNALTDSSGAGQTLTNNGTTTFVGGKYNYGSEHVPGSSQYLSYSSTISGVKSVSFWTNPDSTTNYYISLTASAYITSSSGTLSATGFTDPKYYINGVLTTSPTLSADSWQHVTVTTEDPISANTFYIGRQGSNYYDGTMDEIRLYTTTLSNQDVSKLYNWAPGPLYYYKLDEGTGSSAYDSSTTGNTGSWVGSGSRYDVGKYGKAGTFNASDDGVNIGTVANQPIVSLMAWVYVKADVAGGDDYDALIDGAGNTMLRINGTQGAGADLFEFTVYNGSSFATARYNTNIVTNRWYHVAGSYDGANVTLYINGVPADANTTTSGTAVFGASGIGYSSTHTRFSNTKMDDVRIYNYGRTQAQVIEDMNAGHPAPGSPVGTPVGYWKMDQGVDNLCSGGSNDVCNSGNQGTALDGAASNMAVPATSTSGWTNSGKYNKALIFDGTDDGVITADSAATRMSETESMTFSAWVYPTTISGSSRTIFRYDDFDSLDGDSPADRNVYFLRLNTAGTVTFTFGPTSGLSSLTTTETVSINNWYHIAGVRNVAEDKQYIYINGRQVASKADSTTGTWETTGQYLMIGRMTGEFFTGTIDEAKVFDQALTPSQILLDYNRGSASQVSGLSTSASGRETTSQAAEYCIPGDTATCTAPIARWDFEDYNTGTTFKDTSGNDYTGTMNGTISTSLYRAGKIGKAGTFNGTNNYSTNEDINETDGASQLTVGLWMKPSALGEFTGIIRKTSSGTDRWGIEIGGTGEGGTDDIEVNLNNGSSGNAAHTASDRIVVNNWFHVAFVFDGSLSGNANRLKIFINGKQEPVTFFGTIPATTDSNIVEVELGRTGTTFYNGLMDDVRIYNYARTPAQIAWDYSKGAYPMAGWWKMDECQGTAVNDSSGNTNHGTWSGAGGGNTAAGTCQTSGAWFDGVSGKRNYSLEFDGGDDVVDAGSGPYLDNLGMVINTDSTQVSVGTTMAAWIYPTSEGESDQGVIFSKNSGATPSSGWLWRFSSGTNGLTFTMDGSTDLVRTTADNILTLNAWNHVVLAWDGVITTASSVKMYVNGREVSYGTTTNGAARVSDATQNFRIGNDSAGTSTFTGKIDDARVYNYQMTEQQIRLLFNDGTLRQGPVTGAP